MRNFKKIVVKSLDNFGIYFVGIIEMLVKSREILQRLNHLRIFIYNIENFIFLNHEKYIMVLLILKAKLLLL